MNDNLIESTTGHRAGALRGLRVVEWAQGFGAPLCARLLGDMGADVIKIEPPDGDWTRRAAIFPALNYNKRSLALDAASASDREIARELMASADIVIENHAPGYLDSLDCGFEVISKLRPGIIFTSHTPFGQRGPHSHWKGEDLIGCHSGALAVLIPDWVGDPAKPPLRPAPRQAEVQSALNGAVATLGALLGRARGVPGATAGVHIDVSTQETIIAILHSSLPEYIALGRARDRFSPTIVFAGFTPAKDGMVRIFAATEQHWQKLAELIGAEELIAAADRRDRIKNRDAIEARAAAWASQYTKQEIYHLAQSLRLPFAPLNKPSEVRSEPQMVARGAFAAVDQSNGRSVALPGPPFRSVVTPWAIHRPSPVLSEHSAELLSELARRSDRAAGRTEPAAIDPEADCGPYLPLTGVRVADFSWAWAGPHCGIQFADLGAEVVKVESRNRIDTGRMVGPFKPDEPIDLDKSLRFTNFNRGKAGITLNLREPEALALAHELVTVSDVVIENFAPGVMDRLGLGYERLRSLRPDIVMISLSGFGNTGPEHSYVAYGYTIEAYTGLGELTGYAGGGPEALGLPYADPAGGLMGAAAALAALRHRELTGEGQHIDLSEAETMLTCLTEGFALLATTGQDPPRLGNADRNWSPHGVYPCRDGRWIAIAVSDDAEWRSLIEQMGEPAWASAGELATMTGRLSAREALDLNISGWTAEQEAFPLAERLQDAGVPATVSINAADVMHDPHLAARVFFQVIDHPGMGPRPVHSAPFRFGAEPLPIRRAAPRLGEDNGPVLGELLGTPAGRLQEYAARGLLT